MAWFANALVASVVLAGAVAEMCNQGEECASAMEEDLALLQRAHIASNASTGLSSCPKTIPLGRSSVWGKAYGSHSCHSSKGIRHDTGFACEGDDSSIIVDMSSTRDKIGCFVWQTEDCKWPMRSVSKLEFDVEWTGCDRLWFAAIWTFSYPWAPVTGRQGHSGEIDFVEECVVPTQNTNLGCYDAWQGPGCKDAQHWAAGERSDGVRHMVMTFDGPDLNLDVCSGAGVSSGPTCRQVAYYKNYLNVVYPTTDGRDNLYKFISDVFNDSPGDGGWRGCGASRNYGTNCKYAVTNIQIHSNSNRHIFDENSKCAALNPGSRSSPSRRRGSGPLPAPPRRRSPALDGPQGPRYADNFAEKLGEYLSQEGI